MKSTIDSNYLDFRILKFIIYLFEFNISVSFIVKTDLYSTTYYNSLLFEPLFGSEKDFQVDILLLVPSY